MKTMQKKARRKPIYTIDRKATSTKLLSLRKAKGYSVKDVVVATSVTTVQAVYRWEKQGNGVLPSVDDLYRLSRLYQVSMQELLVGTAG